MSEHTSGPWTHDYGNDTGPNDDYFVEFYEIFSGDNVIGQFENEDDARLASSAPDLLEAIESLLENHTQLVNCGDCGNWDVELEPEVVSARAAIARARGES